MRMKVGEIAGTLHSGFYVLAKASLGIRIPDMLSGTHQGRRIQPFTYCWIEELARNPQSFPGWLTGSATKPRSTAAPHFVKSFLISCF